MDPGDLISQLVKQVSEVNLDHLWLSLSISFTGHRLIDESVCSLTFQGLKHHIGKFNLVFELEAGVVLFIVQLLHTIADLLLAD